MSGTAHTLTFLRPTKKETARREIVSFLELEKCRLEVLLMAGKFKDMPDVYQDLFCVYAKHIEAFEDTASAINQDRG
jgi:hypothetical protein